MDIIKKLENRKEKLIQLEKDRTRVEVLYEQALARLKEMGLNSIEEAQAELDRRIAANKQVEAEAEKLIMEFDEKYKDFL